VKRSILHLSLLSFTLLLGSCSAQKIARITLKKIKPDYSFTPDSLSIAPDYSNTDDWFVYQDSLDEEIDVFFIHPTTYLSDQYWNQPLSDSLNTAKTMRRSISQQALLFDSIANVFAPRYRHATFYSFFDADSNGIKALNVAFLDIKAAFEYFIEHANRNKPIIIAGHSQGSFLGIKLLKDKHIQQLIGDRLVIAYLIGWPVQEDDLLAMPYNFCEDASDLGCIASWNAQKKHTPVSMKSYTGKATVYSTNPLSWKTDSEYYSKSYNKGAHILVGDSIVIRPYYLGAQNYKGFLAIDRPPDKKELKIRRHSGNYHVYDIAFFYENLQENAALRKEVYLKQAKK